MFILRYCPRLLAVRSIFLNASELRQITLTIGGSIIVWLISNLTSLDLTKQSSFNISKAAESKQNKQEVGHTMILSPKVSLNKISYPISDTI